MLSLCHPGLEDGSYARAVRQHSMVTIRDRGTIFYRRLLGKWERRVSHTAYTDLFEPCRRLPRAIRELHEQQNQGTIEADFNTCTRTAKRRFPGSLLEV